MSIGIGSQDINKFIMVGDRVLIKPKSQVERTKGGLLLPPGVQEKETIRSGYVVKVGPGYPIPAIAEENEIWQNKNEKVKYIPLQPNEGDLVVYLQNSCWEIEFNNEKYVIAPHSSILMIIRDEGLFE